MKSPVSTSPDAASLIAGTCCQKPAYPLPRYPTGWFQVAYSDELKPGDVKPLGYFGKPLVLFRTESGKPSVLDARCPHMSAHLGRGGKVKGESIVCPSHGWQFGVDGACTGVPYLRHIPMDSSATCWPLREESGLVMIWHDIDKRPPAWDLPPVPELSSDDWTMPARREWKIRTSNHELAENLIGRAHFGHPRGNANEREPFIQLDGHKVCIATPMTMRTPAANVEGRVESVAMGLGFATNHLHGSIEAMLIGCVTPIDKEYVHLRLGFTFRKGYADDDTSGEAEAFVAEASHRIEEDKLAWEGELRPEQPLRSDNDGPIGQFRDWAGQFYPDWYKEEARATYEAARPTNPAS